MYKSMLFLHWKQIGPALALATVASFALPLMVIEGLGTVPGTQGLEPYEIISGVQRTLWFFPTLAFAIGMTLALSAWNWDHQLKHVYALSLPMTRWEYSLQKLLAGMTLCAVPVVGFWMGSHLAVSFVDLPTGLNAYPNELAVRFLFATLISYALLFAMAAGTVRTTIWVSGIVFAFLFLGTITNDILGDYFVFFSQVEVVELVVEWMVNAPGPFEVFTGSWSLIDV